MKSSIKANTVDCNIEFGHVYINENFTSEHYKAVEILKHQIELFNKQGVVCSTTLLIDDYNPTEKLLNIKNFIQELSEMGGAPDYVVYEAKLTLFKDEMLALMTGKIKRRYSDYIEKNKKCPCSFLVAVWYLVRLGVLRNNLVVEARKKKPFIARTILTILPQRYGSVEKRALEIIKSTPHAHLISDSIEYIFF